MFWCRCKKEMPYKVVVHLNGRHPYLQSNELDYDTRDVTLVVAARDWNHAADVGMEAARTIPNKWSWHVVSVSTVISA